MIIKPIHPLYILLNLKDLWTNGKSYFYPV